MTPMGISRFFLSITRSPSLSISLSLLAHFIKLQYTHIQLNFGSVGLLAGRRSVGWLTAANILVVCSFVGYIQIKATSKNSYFMKKNWMSK